MNNHQFGWIYVRRDFELDGVDLRAMPPFFISRRRITVGQFEQFCRETSYITIAEQGKFSDNYAKNFWLAELKPSEIPEQPALEVSYLDAMAYCTWAGVCLPTDQQWIAASVLSPTRILNHQGALDEYNKLRLRGDVIQEIAHEITSTRVDSQIVIRRGPHLILDESDSVWSDRYRVLCSDRSFASLSFRVCKLA
jgi:hypothetical protein